MTNLLSWVDSRGQAWCVELMSIYVYILVTDTFIIVCYNKKEREKEGQGERERDHREGREEWKVIPTLEKIYVFTWSTLTLLPLLLLWDVTCSPRSDFIMHHPVPHDGQPSLQKVNQDSWHGGSITADLGGSPSPSTQDAPRTFLTPSRLQHPWGIVSWLWCANASLWLHLGTLAKGMPICFLV